jgi:hypothetical protein
MKDAFLRKTAYERGLVGCTFATADEYRHPEYDENYAKGMYVRQGARPDCKHVSRTTADGNGAYCILCGETLA